MFLKMPIAVSLALSGFVGLVVIMSPEAAFRVVAKDIYANFASYSLSVIPMFVFMGYVAFHSGIGQSLFNLAYKIVGHLSGGLAIAAQLTCGAFGAVCGSTTATAATIGAIALPEMKKYKYNDSLSTASVAAGGAMSALIPPSTVMIVYGIATEQSIGRLFLSGIVPGIILLLLFILTVYLLTKRDPSLAPKGPKAPFKEIVHALKGGVLEVAIVFAVALGGLFMGVFTSTESGAIGAFAILVISLAERRLNLKGVIKALRDTTKTSAMIMLIVGGAVVFGRLMAVSRLPFELAQWAGDLPFHSVFVVAIVFIIYVVIGLFMDSMALILLTVPIFYPVVVTTLGYDPIWFGVIIVMVMAAGVITPPVGMNVYVIKGIAPDIPLMTIYRGIWPFLGAIFVCVGILIAFPTLCTFLPNLLMGK